MSNRLKGVPDPALFPTYDEAVEAEREAIRILGHEKVAEIKRMCAPTTFKVVGAARKMFVCGTGSPDKRYKP